MDDPTHPSAPARGIGLFFQDFITPATKKRTLGRQWGGGLVVWSAAVLCSAAFVSRLCLLLIQEAGEGEKQDGKAKRESKALPHSTPNHRSRLPRNHRLL
jgi:hypothetical protein